MMKRDMEAALESGRKHHLLQFAKEAVAKLQEAKELMYDLLWEMCDCDDKIYAEACSVNRYPSESAEKLHNIAIRMDGLLQSWEQKVRELSKKEERT
jgi:hypothetical protein